MGSHSVEYSTWQAISQLAFCNLTWRTSLGACPCLCDGLPDSVRQALTLCP